MGTNLHVDVLDELLDGLARCMTPDVARRVVDLRASSAVQARVDELAEKCNEGQLTADERAEYEAYVAAADFISILQAKARRILSGQSAA